MMMPHLRIFQNKQNYAVWPHTLPPFPSENAAVFPCPPLVFKPHPGRVIRNKRRDFHRTGSGPGHTFKLGNPNESKTPPANRSGAKGRRIHYPRRTFGRGGGGNRLTPPLAPLNTTSFIIRAKNSGGIAPLVSPSGSLSPAKFDERAAEEQWGFNGYGSMKGLIRLRPGNFDSGDISGAGRFEMVNPTSGDEQNLDKRVDEQDSHLAHLEEENLTLKEKLLLMEKQLGDLRRRVQFLETDGTTSHGDREGGAENFLTGDVFSVKKVDGKTNEKV
ncbi:unnamed protein product [Sphenostylis stenocarpa]|uniref:PRLI-interacting factor A n=1 Tax=Sphenostylis stenocarpa TaxID=92480 RepID=A0AA86SH32_9FABA|nr:unnamed protein product [Sphenostylis stenocarpa]